MAESFCHVLESGIPVPSFVVQENLDKLKTLELYPDDVWIVTYPKCGTTWTQQIVKLIRNNGVQDGVRPNLAVPWLEATEMSYYKEAGFRVDELKRPRAFKSHFPYDLLPCGPPHTTPCKYIYVIRNPKDVAVSLYFHNLRSFPAGTDWNVHWKKYIEGSFEFGRYIDHLLSWWLHRDEENVMFLKYEDMKKDIKQAISDIALFIGKSVSDDIIAKIADLSSFETMQKEDVASSLGDPKRQEKQKISPFIRKGEVGDWKNFLTPEQSAEMDAIVADRLKDTDITFDYE